MVRPNAPGAGDEQRKSKECKRCIDVIDNISRRKPPARKRKRDAVPTPAPSRRSRRIRLLAERRVSLEGNRVADPSPQLEAPISPCSWGYWSDSDSDTGPEIHPDEGAQGGMGAVGRLGLLGPVSCESPQSPPRSSPSSVTGGSLRELVGRLKGPLASSSPLAVGNGLQENPPLRRDRVSHHTLTCSPIREILLSSL